MKTTRKLEPRMKRKLRMRSKVAGNAERPRMCVYRSLCHIYVQLIDDDKGSTLCSASTMSKDLQKGLKSTKSAEAAKKVGKALAEKALAQGITKVIFDRNGYKYHGRVKLLADSAREAGLNF